MTDKHMEEFRESIKEYICFDGTILKIPIGEIEGFVIKDKLKTLEEVEKMIEKIDVSGGGSGRRLKVQLLAKLKQCKDKLK